MPVRIALDPKELAAYPLRVGLSATASVDVTQKGGAQPGSMTPAARHDVTTALAEPLDEARKASDAIVANNLLGAVFIK